MAEQADDAREREEDLIDDGLHEAEFDEAREEALSDTYGQAITKDNYESLFEVWCDNLDPSEWMEFGNEYADKRYLDGKEEVLKALEPHINNLRKIESEFSDLKVKDF